MMKELIERAIDMDVLMVLHRTRYILSSIRNVSQQDFGAPLDAGDLQLLYIAGKPGALTEMEQAYAKKLIANCKQDFTIHTLRLVMLYGAKKAGWLMGATDTFAQTLWAGLAA